MPEKHPINIPKLMLSPDFRIFNILEGFLKIDLRDRTREIADLMLYPKRKDLIKEMRVDYTQPSGCLQCTVL